MDRVAIDKQLNYFCNATGSPLATPLAYFVYAASVRERFITEAVWSSGLRAARSVFAATERYVPYVSPALRQVPVIGGCLVDLLTTVEQSLVYIEIY